MPCLFDHVSLLGGDANYACESLTVETLRISDPHVWVKSEFRVSTGSASMDMEWLARIPLVGEEEKSNPIQAKYDWHEGALEERSDESPNI